ncbi:hypothetical protein C1H69_20950 [Billgrantia endophytica]|uniref:Uncharacterized protein n=1 Tax=Billgrantia endophytica TaxID=2033802 RepID=A0A2N7TWA1_9GAMM|nr:hypothetical protein C1H69_20950 [Halomonas endophytica]
MIEYRKTSRRELEERILFLQLTLTTLKEQLDAQHSLDDGSPRGRDDRPPACRPPATPTSDCFETPLAIAAG